MTFVDRKGTAVQNVELMVDDSHTLVPNSLTSTLYLREPTKFPLVSDSNGLIVCFTNGQSFGGTIWHLFWVVPMGRHPGDFSVPVSTYHLEYSINEFMLSELLQNRTKRYSDFPKTQIKIAPDHVIEVPIYSKRITLGG